MGNVWDKVNFNTPDYVVKTQTNSSEKCGGFEHTSNYYEPQTLPACGAFYKEGMKKILEKMQSEVKGLQSLAAMKVEADKRQAAFDAKYKTDLDSVQGAMTNDPEMILKIAAFLKLQEEEKAVANQPTE